MKRALRCFLIRTSSGRSARDEVSVPSWKRRSGSATSRVYPRTRRVIHTSRGTNGIRDQYLTAMSGCESVAAHNRVDPSTS